MKNTLTIILFLATIMCLLLFTNCQKSRTKEDHEQRFREKAELLVDMIARQDILYDSIVEHAGSQVLKETLTDENTAWHELTLAWINVDYAFNYYQRDALLRPDPHGWIPFLESLLVKRDSSLTVLRSIIIEKHPSSQNDTLKKMTVYDNKQVFDELSEQWVFRESEREDSARIAFAFLGAWMNFSSTRHRVSILLPDSLKGSYELDTQQYYNYAMLHLGSNVRFRGDP